MAKFLRTSGRAGLRRYLDATARALIRIGVSANAVTLTGTALIVAASVLLVSQGQILIALIVITLSAFTDLLDGSIARVKGTTSRFGALLDSTCDRLADGAILGGLAYWLFTEDRLWAASFALWALIASEVVSYVKARAESLGIECNVGIAERAERLVLIGVTALAGIVGVPYAEEVGLGLLAVLTSITVVQRLVHARKSMDQREERIDA